MSFKGISWMERGARSQLFCKNGHYKTEKGIDSLKRCRECLRESYKKFYHSNKGERAFRRRNFQLKKFGLSAESFNVLLQTQNYQCIGCLVPADGYRKKLSVDHDHKTGRVRGLLCNNCNLALGNAKDSVETLRRLIGYLEGGK